MECGYRGTRLEAVAQRAGVTTGAIYSIFGGKRELFLVAFQELDNFPRLADVAEPGTAMTEVLSRFGRAWAGQISGPHLAMRYTVSLELLLDMRGDPAAEQRTRLAAEQSLAELASELRTFARAAHERLPRPAPELALALIAALSGLGIARVQTDLPSDELFGYVAASLWAGPPARSSRRP